VSVDGKDGKALADASDGVPLKMREADVAQLVEQPIRNCVVPLKIEQVTRYLTAFPAT
jgi:hypothetical protein